MNTKLLPRYVPLVLTHLAPARWELVLLALAALAIAVASPSFAAEDAREGAHFVVFQAPAKSPIPSKELRDAKRAEIDSIFETSKAASLTEKVALAQRLLRTAQDTRDDAVARFELLNMARELASEGARMQIAFDAIELMQLEFDFDADGVRLVTITQGSKAAVPLDAKGEVIVYGSKLAERLVQQDRYAEASKLISSLMDPARRARDQIAVARLIEQKKQIDLLAADFSKLQTLLDKLKANPDDPQASTAAGKYYLFQKNDPQQGLKLLAKSDNAALAEVAKLELTQPQNPADQEKLADLWWELAGAETSKPAKEKLQERALSWYIQAAPQMKGLMQVKANSRIRQLTTAGIKPVPLMSELGIFSRPPRGSEMPNSPIPESVPAAALPTNLLDLVNVEKDAMRQTWIRRDDHLYAPNEYACSLQIPATVKGEYTFTAEFSRVDSDDIVGFMLPVGDDYCEVILSTDGGAASYIGEGSTNRSKIEPGRLKNGQRYVFSARVTKNGENYEVDAKLDGQDFGKWAGRGVDSVGKDAPRAMRTANHLGLYAHTSAAQFFSVEVEPIRGTVTADRSEVYGSTKPKTPPPMAATDGKIPLNLLELVDPEKDAINQKWERRDDGSIAAKMAYASLLQVPVTIDGDYEVYTEFTREEGADIAGLVLPVNDRFCGLLFSAQAGEHALLGVETSTMLRVAPFQLTNGQRYKVRVRVVNSPTSSTVTIFFDDKQIAVWSGIGSAGLEGTRKMRSTHHLGLSGHKASVVFHTLQLTMLKGSAQADNRRDIPEVQHPLGLPATIKRVLYGKPGAMKDITQEYADVIARHPMSAVHVDERVFGSPQPGDEFQLVVTYTFNGNNYEVSVPYLQAVPLPSIPTDGIAIAGASREFKIVSGYLLGGLNPVDMTVSVAKAVTDPRAPIRWSLTNENPWNRTKNYYIIWFDLDGKRYSRAIRETSTAALLP